MSRNNHGVMSLAFWRRSFMPELVVIVAGVVVLLLVAFGHAFAGPAVPSSADQLAALDARTKTYTETFSKTYNATDVNYDGRTVTMTVGDQSYKCEAPPIEKLADRPNLRCETLTIVKPADTAGK